jgi:hypothetical protein
MILILLLVFVSLPFAMALPPPAWYLQVDHQRGDLVPWAADILGEFRSKVRVVGGVSLQAPFLFSWRMPRSIERGCTSAGFDLEVTGGVRRKCHCEQRRVERTQSGMES